MIGDIVPLVLIPRFTSYVGDGEFTTLALDVSAYKTANVEFWRGPLMGSGDLPTGASFIAAFQEANQADADSSAWSQIGSSINSASDNDLLSLSLSKKYLRVRITLTKSSSDNAAITCWVSGNLEKRIPGGSQ